MKKEFFVDFLKSFSLGNPEVREAWRQLIVEEENKDKDVIAFSVPKKLSGELIVMIERLIADKIYWS